MNDLPIQRLLDLKKSGLDNDRIFQILMKEGFTSEQITESLRRIELTNQVGNMTEAPYPNMNVPPPMPPRGNPNGRPPMPPQRGPPMGGPQNMGPRPNFQNQSVQISQIAESIIEEKWKALMENINKIVMWKEGVETKINRMENDVEVLRKEFDNLNKALMNRLGDSDSAIKNVSVDLKALTTVFEKILPGFIENMHSLSRITKELQEVREDFSTQKVTETPIQRVERRVSEKPVEREVETVSRVNTPEPKEEEFESLNDIKEEIKSKSKPVTKKTKEQKSEKESGDIFSKENQENGTQNPDDDDSIDDLL